MRRGTMGNPYQNIDYWSHLCGSFTGIGAGVLINRHLHLKQGQPALKDNKNQAIQPVR